ncbi:cilia- and flagella-associated protein 298-like isoform X2 [Empidonax traillii]|uniref:cilia- and flagella-associated protein 298-like isoform X2 n=1 Tax=Empidonax traillii TaxID=164674 RepID=UPI000FFD232C|nr:cilia- and flagella-associated protein 298-like isoform X2 [Empidonax traillii]
MVRLHVKRGGESQFLLEAPGSSRLAELAPLAARIHNGRLKVQRLCSEMEELAEHGISLPYNMQGLTDEQIGELKLKDEWAEKCVPSGGSVFRKDELGRRNGHAPNEKMQQVIKKTIEEAKALISKKGQGAPGREPVISHEEQKEMMLYYYRKQEELKKLEEDDNDSFLNAEWADNQALKRQFHGVKDIKWGPR